jgi:polygalacturonase
MEKSVQSRECRVSIDAFDIRKFGAVGDGTTVDTRAVQQAMDAATQSGGGVVLCPPGAYRIGSILLKDRVER